MEGHPQDYIIELIEKLETIFSTALPMVHITLLLSLKC